MPATTLETDGFLSDEIVEVIRAFKAETPKLHDDFRFLGRLAHQQKNAQPVGNEDVQKLMIVLLIGRLLSLYEAVYVLACRGMKSEHQTLLRTMLEAHLKLHLCIQSQEDAEALALSGEYSRVRFLRNAIKYRKDIESAEQLQELENLKAKTEADIKAQKINAFSIKEIAERTNRLWEYELTYALLCQPTHLDSRNLQSSFELNEKGGIKGILWGPDHEEAGVNIATAMDYLFQAITNPVVTMLPPDAPEAKLLRDSINEHIRTQHRLKHAKKGAVP